MPMSPMSLIGEDKNGIKWYFADNHFTNPGVYFWDGKENIHVHDRIRQLETELSEAVKAKQIAEEWTEQFQQHQARIIVERDQLKKELEEARKEADRQTEIADAMTNYVPEAGRELKLQSQLAAMTKAAEGLVEPTSKLVCIDSDGTIIATNQLCDCLHHPKIDQHKDNELCPIVQRLGKALAEFERVRKENGV